MDLVDWGVGREVGEEVLVNPIVALGRVRLLLCCISVNVSVKYEV